MQLSVIIIVFAEVWSIYKLGLDLKYFILGFSVAISSGTYLASRDWLHIESVLSTTRIITKPYYSEIVGLKWPFWLSIVHLSFYPLKGSDFLLSTYVFVGGIISGTLAIYYLVLAVRVFFRERKLGMKIIINWE